MPWLTDKLFHLVINERIVDYSFVHQNIGLDGKGRILDVGCHGSKLVIELASLGYETYSIDGIEYPLQHPNFTFVQGDICKTPFPDDFFDAVTAVSTIEHIGLGRYEDPTYSNGDKKAVKEIKRILKP
jgi:SAM-dependent methyltransferase